MIFQKKNECLILTLEKRKILNRPLFRKKLSFKDLVSCHPPKKKADVFFPGGIEPKL